MNREGIKKHWKVFKAWLSGAEIQWRNKTLIDRWIGTNDPEFRPDYEYRVEPERKWKSRQNNTGKKTRGPSKGPQNEHQSMTQIRARLKDVNYVWEGLLRGRRFDKVKYRMLSLPQG